MSSAEATAPSGAEGPSAPTAGIKRWPAPKSRRYLEAAAYVVAATVVSEVIYERFATNRLSMVFLAAVLVAAVRLGRGPSFFAALLSFAVYNFYLVEPRFIILLGSVEDYFVLAGFLAVALLTGTLAGKLRDEKMAAQARAGRMAALFEASREMSVLEGEAGLRERIAARLGEATGGPAWVVGDGEPAPAAWAALPPPDRQGLERMFAHGDRWGPETVADGPWRMRPLVADGRRMGKAFWRGEDARAGDETDSLTRLLAEVGAGALARARLSAEKTEAETVAQAEKLRTALLSSISHDFRTPLAAILASASSLIDFEAQFDAATRKDLVSNIQEEAERLNRFVANLLNMTRLESGVLDLSIVPVPVQEIAARAVERLRRRIGARKVAFTSDGKSLVADADPVLLEQVLINLVENAANFSPDGSVLSIHTRRDGAAVRLEVADEGPGAPRAELHRLFDKFYRASNARPSAQGAGLGLSICRGLVEAMGGTIEAQARADGARGLAVVVKLRSAEP